jgi:hypothetical protein
MSLTEWAAWVGASSGLCSLLWNVYTKLSSGPKLRMTTTPNIRKWPETKKGEHYITARVQNIGTAKTTLTNMCFATYSSSWKRLRRQPTGNWVVISSSQAQPIPFGLDVGEEWTGFAIQEKDIQQILDAGKLWCEIYHSWSKRPIRSKVITTKVEAKEDSSPKDK